MIMKTSEVRIGNYVHFGNTKSIIKIDISTLLSMEMGAEYTPIRLDEDVLEYVHPSITDLFDIWWDKKEKCYKFLYNKECNTTIKYVHQLQNLYYSSFNQELLIEL